MCSRAALTLAWLSLQDRHRAAAHILGSLGLLEGTRQPHFMFRPSHCSNPKHLTELSWLHRRHAQLPGGHPFLAEMSMADIPS